MGLMKAPNPQTGNWEGVDALALNDGNGERITVDRIKNTETQLMESKQDLLDRAVNVNAFGAVGDGIHDDTSAIEAALLTGMPVTGGNKNLYRTTRTIVVPYARVVGNLTIQPSGAFMALDIGASSVAASTIMTGATVPRGLSITVANANGFQVGQLIKIKSNALWYYDSRDSLTKGEIHLIKSISGLTITLSEPLWDVYNSETEIVMVDTFDQTEQTHINGLSVNYLSSTDVMGVRIRNSVNPLVDNLTVKKTTLGGLNISTCYGAIITNPQMIETCSESSETGYGIQDNSSFATVISNGFFYRCRRGVDFSGTFPSRGGTVANSTAVCWSQDKGDGFGTHGTAEFIEFIGNSVYGGRYGFLVRGGNVKVIGNKIYGFSIAAILHSAGDNITVEGNTSYSSLPNRKFSSNVFLPPTFYVKSYATTDSKGINVIKGNTAFGLREKFIEIYTNDNHLIAKNNTVHLHSNGTGYDVNFINAPTTVTINNSLFINNTLRTTNGVRKFFGSNVILGEQVDYDERVLTTSNLEVWNGTGTLENVTLDVAVTKQNGVASVIGTVKFDVATSPVKLALNSLPRTAQLLWKKGFKYDNMSDVLLHATSTNSNKIYISSDALNYNTSYSVGSGYTVSIDIRYRTSKDYNFA